MRVIKSNLKDCFIFEPDIFDDSRGFFLETYQKEKFSNLGLKETFVQDNHSRSSKGVLRGLHFQKKNPQGKLVYVARGEVFDVVVDLRRDSETFGSWDSFKLNHKNRKLVWVPPGFAHGFQVISDEADFIYKCTNYYDPKDEEVILWNDQFLNINWPIENSIVSDKDSKGKKFKDIFS